MGASNACLFESRYASPGIVPVGVSEGSWVVVDPTGRDVRECYEVGVVLEVQRGEDGPSAVVALNSGGVVTCTDISAVLA